MALSLTIIGGTDTICRLAFQDQETGETELIEGGECADFVEAIARLKHAQAALQALATA